MAKMIMTWLLGKQAVGSASACCCFYLPEYLPMLWKVCTVVRSSIIGGDHSNYGLSLMKFSHNKSLIFNKENLLLYDAVMFTYLLCWTINSRDLPAQRELEDMDTIMAKKK